jgi:hypothetical protein
MRSRVCAPTGQARAAFRPAGTGLAGPAQAAAAGTTGKISGKELISGVTFGKNAISDHTTYPLTFTGLVRTTSIFTPPSGNNAVLPTPRGNLGAIPPQVESRSPSAVERHRRIAAGNSGCGESPQFRCPPARARSFAESPLRSVTSPQVILAVESGPATLPGCRAAMA